MDQPTAPTKMILLDPDLNADAAPKKSAVRRSGVSGASKRNLKTNLDDLQLPSARALARFLAAAQDAARLKGQVTVLLTTDAAIRRLNRQFRGKNKATDVLSFPAERLGRGAERVAGDLAVSVTTALRQAREHGHPLATEIKVLVLHGVLHLAGYDHEVDSGQMARRELALRAKLKLPQGLIERAEDDGAVNKSPSGARARDLKGDGFSRAAGSARRLTTLAAQGVLVSSKRIPQGLKPKQFVKPPSARLKSGPSKATASSETAGKSDDAQGLKPKHSVEPSSARLKSGPSKATASSEAAGKSDDAQGLKPKQSVKPSSARLKSGPSKARIDRSAAKAKRA